MKKFNLIWILLVAFSATYASEFPDKPNPPRLVNDFANILSSSDRERLEKKLVTFDDTTSTQISIVTVQTIYGYDIDDYNQRLGELWGVGRKGKNNGVVILVAKQERKVSIATGYGLEPVLTDILSKRIIENNIVPNFKQGDFYRGLDEGTTAIMQVATGEFKAEERNGIDIFLIIFIVCIFVFFIVLVVIFTKSSQYTYSGKGQSSRSGWGGGPWIGGGGFGGGSWGGGGSSGGGGFGGFGGGSFGGGGASGSW